MTTPTAITTITTMPTATTITHATFTIIPTTTAMFTPTITFTPMRKRPCRPPRGAARRARRSERRPRRRGRCPAAGPRSRPRHDGHDHGWAPWRYAVLLLPVAIYFVVPLDALSAAGAKPVEVDASAVARRGDERRTISSITFQQLELAALYPENRAFYEGKTVRLVGQYVPKATGTFTLRRLKISCCVADGVPAQRGHHDRPQVQGRRCRRTSCKASGCRSSAGSSSCRAPAAAYATTLILTPTKDRPLDEAGEGSDRRPPTRT